MRKQGAISKRSAYLMAFIALLVTTAVIAYPEESFKASLDGVRVWWEIVFPALLPFFIAAEVLMGLGVVHFLGALLEPLMRPLFDIPGVGAFAVAMGLASGYPMGARITGRLRRENLCTRVEAERLLAFSNTADPLFMAGAVAVGMFEMPSLGPVIVAAHYISSILLGFIMRLHGRTEGESIPVLRLPKKRESILAKALRDLYRARRNDGRSFGQLFGDSVKDSVNSLLLIGGVIIMFSVIIRVLTIVGVTKLIAVPLGFLMKSFGMSDALAPSFISGLFEITIGSELASKAACPLVQRVMAASAIIAWSGLSVFAQVTSMTEGTDIRMGPYVVARVIQAVLAMLITLVLMTGPAGEVIGGVVVPTFVTKAAAPGVSLATRLWLRGAHTLLITGLLVAASLIVRMSRSFSIFGFKIDLRRK
ncbi:MAG TPA: sporulation integral membrane protein YlbJ [Firmicutes bacterium]|nr:sporulation integral membrane protein YlbJ [Bacillota bacterium]